MNDGNTVIAATPPDQGPRGQVLVTGGTRVSGVTTSCSARAGEIRNRSPSWLTLLVGWLPRSVLAPLALASQAVESEWRSLRFPSIHQLVTGLTYRTMGRVSSLMASFKGYGRLPGRYPGCWRRLPVFYSARRGGARSTDAALAGANSCRWWQFAATRCAIVKEAGLLFTFRYGRLYLIVRLPTRGMASALLAALPAGTRDNSQWLPFRKGFSRG